MASLMDFADVEPPKVKNDQEVFVHGNMVGYIGPATNRSGMCFVWFRPEENDQYLVDGEPTISLDERVLRVLDNHDASRLISVGEDGRVLEFEFTRYCDLSWVGGQDPDTGEDVHNLEFSEADHQWQTDEIALTTTFPEMEA